MNLASDPRALVPEATDAARLLHDLSRGALVDGGLEGIVYPTGFDPLDRVLSGGIRQHDLFVLAGRPGVGKTIAALQIARNLAHSGVTVLYACYEHDPVVLLSRLLALEIGAIRPPGGWLPVDSVRSLLDEIMTGLSSLSAPTTDPIIRAARARMDEYAHRLHLLKAAPSQTGVTELWELVERVQDGPTVLVVDYLQKVRPAVATSTHLEHMSLVTASLKEAALSSDIAVLGIGAVGTAGLLRKRAHLPHLDAAVAVGYDADVVILLNDKRSIISPGHTLTTLEQLDRMNRRVVFTIEKNRRGLAPIDLEFVKGFEFFRFDTSGSYVSEQLIEDGVETDFRS